jgi:hypothetical protein
MAQGKAGNATTKRRTGFLMALRKTKSALKA